MSRRDDRRAAVAATRVADALARDAGLVAVPTLAGPLATRPRAPGGCGRRRSRCSSSVARIAASPPAAAAMPALLLALVCERVARDPAGTESARVRARPSSRRASARGYARAEHEALRRIAHAATRAAPDAAPALARSYASLCARRIRRRVPARLAAAHGGRPAARRRARRRGAAPRSRRGAARAGGPSARRVRRGHRVAGRRRRSRPRSWAAAPSAMPPAIALAPIPDASDAKRLAALDPDVMSISRGCVRRPARCWRSAPRGRSRRRPISARPTSRRSSIASSSPAGAISAAARWNEARAAGVRRGPGRWRRWRRCGRPRCGRISRESARPRARGIARVLARAAGPRPGALPARNRVARRRRSRRRARRNSPRRSPPLPASSMRGWRLAKLEQAAGRPQSAAAVCAEGLAADGGPAAAAARAGAGAARRAATATARRRPSPPRSRSSPPTARRITTTASRCRCSAGRPTPRAPTSARWRSGPTSPPPISISARCSRSRARPMPPITAYESVLEAEPTNAAAYKNLGEVLLGAGRIDAWLANFSRFERHCPDCAVARRAGARGLPVSRRLRRSSTATSTGFGSERFAAARRKRALRLPRGAPLPAAVLRRRAGSDRCASRRRTTRRRGASTASLLPARALSEARPRCASAICRRTCATT